MTDRRRRVAQIALAIALVAGGLWLVLNRNAADPSARADASAPVPMESAAPPAPVAANPRAAPRSSAPLPLPGTPIAELITALKPRADAGDSRAACRLAIELLRCRHLDEASRFTPANGQPLDVTLAQQGASEAADRFAEMEIRQIELAKQCGTVEPAVRDLAPQYLAQAAFAGEPEAMVRYAVGQHHGVSGGSGFLRDPDFERWRRESPGMLLRAARAGRLDAVNPLGLSYRSNATPFAGLVADNPVQGLAWGLVYSRLSGAARPAFENDDPAVQAAASALAGQWHARYFNNAVLAGNFAALHLQPLHMPMQPLDQERFCEPPRTPAGAAGL